MASSVAVARSELAAPRVASRADAWQIVGLALVALVTCAAYWPALNGGMLWDDNAHLTAPALRSVHGLERIWLDLPRPNSSPPPAWIRGATQQYYPLLHSLFWLEYQLWGENTLGYHLANLALHLIATGLVFVVLRKLAIPGALLAAAIFAVHPVQVETVAWITEQKNTLSAVFYLAAMLAYLHFDSSRRGGWYALALMLFVLALLSKTVTATLPAALLVIFWWRRGRLTWRDVGPLVPFFVLGAVAGLYTSWVERHIIGADGEDFGLSLVERGMLAGRVVWFYLGKLVWPTDLMFSYPRWHIDTSQWRQWLFPVAAVATLVALWLIRGRVRAPLTAALFFVGTLFPVLGFFNVYPFLFSLVADHFQYLASLGVITLAAGGVSAGLARMSRPAAIAGGGLCVLLVAALAWATHEQSKIYCDATTLYRETLARNPDSWMASNNLATILMKEHRPQEAVALLERALQIKPNYKDAHLNLSSALLDLGREQDAIRHLDEFLQAEPDNAAAQNNLGNALLKAHREAEAIQHLEEAVRLKPDYAEAHNNLGNALVGAVRVREALDHFERAIGINPDYFEAQSNRAIALRNLGRPDEAIAQCQIALRLKPDDAAVHNNWGAALLNLGKTDEAIGHFQKAAGVQPDLFDAHSNLGTALLIVNRPADAIEALQRAIKLRPDHAQSWANMASAHALQGDVAEALAAAEKAFALANEQGDTKLAAQLESWLPALRAAQAAPSEQTNGPQPAP